MDGVVVVAFGPRAVTRTAVDRARRHGVPVTVVPATRTAQRGLRSLRSRLVHTVETPGREGLTNALAGHLAGDVVLLVHDDVTVHPDGAQLLAERAAEADALAVASSNDPDADGYVGELAPDVVPPLRELDDEPARRFRMSCMAGTSEQLAGLLHHRMTNAHAVVTLPRTDAVLVRRVVALHLDACKDQLLPPEGPDGRPLLVAALIVRDEEEFLDDCLASLEGLVDRIEVCDTGSTDRTIEIARAHGAGVIEREWRDDFGWARNEVLAQCRDAWWVLSIDADERVVAVDVEDFRARLATSVDDQGGVSVPYSDVDAAATRVTTDYGLRVFPSDSRFAGRIHEIPHRPDGGEYRWLVDDGLRLTHLGYRPEVMAKRDKGTRNVTIARTQHEADDDAASAYHLARSLRIHQPSRLLGDEVLALVERIVDDVRTDDDGLNGRTRADVLVTLAWHHHTKGEPQAAMELAAEALDHEPSDAAALELHARSGVHLGRFDEVVEREGTTPSPMPGGYDRPWIEVELAVQRAKAHLALEDVDGARAALLPQLAEPVPIGFDAWLDLVSLVALVAPATADELLLPSAVAAPDAELCKATTKTFHPQDAAEFTTRVALDPHTRHGAEQKAMVALASAVVAERADLVEQLVSAQVVPMPYVRRMHNHATRTGRASIAEAMRGPARQR